jgi:hypothetical protein
VYRYESDFSLFSSYLLSAVDFAVFCTHLDVVGGCFYVQVLSQVVHAGVSQPCLVLGFETQFEQAYPSTASLLAE